MKELKHATLTDSGYIIVDLAERRMHLHTFSGNRRDAWDKLCPREMRSSWKKNGMQCVYVTLQGGFWFTPLPEDEYL
jgi:hypothetical protein